MLHLEEAILRHDPQQRNFLILNHPLPQHRSVILGISGDPNLLVNQENTTADGIPLIKRYTGGGTVFINEAVRFAGFVMNKEALPNVKPFPHDVMKWTELVYKGAFRKLESDTQHLWPQPRELDFSLRKNDYVFGELKVGGNAQTLTRNRWTHVRAHTSAHISSY
jgi:lipoate-protein ligase A